MRRPNLMLLSGALFVAGAYFAPSTQARSSLKETPASALISNGQALKGELLHLRGAYCVDPGGAGFVCAMGHNGRPIQIQASLLGPDTSLSVANTLISLCKGTANLDSADCRFDIEIIPMSVERRMVSTAAGSQQLITIRSNMIDMYRRR